jgi:hypothetical protein
MNAEFARPRPPPPPLFAFFVLFRAAVFFADFFAPVALPAPARFALFFAISPPLKNAVRKRAARRHTEEIMPHLVDSRA